MNLLKNLFDGEKEQQEKQRKVTKIVHDKKNKFTVEMLKVQRQSHKVREQSQKALDESIKLVEMVESVTKEIAIATGGIKDGE